MLHCVYCYCADPHEERKMTVDGVMRFLDDLCLSPESRTVLILAWRFKAETQCEFTRDEFTYGMRIMGWVCGCVPSAVAGHFVGWSDVDC